MSQRLTLAEAIDTIANGGGPAQTVTAEAFERAQAQTAGLTLSQFRRFWAVEPCKCDRELCDGWRLVRRLTPRPVILDREPGSTMRDVERSIGRIRPRMRVEKAVKMVVRDGKLGHPQGRPKPGAPPARPVWVVYTRWAV